MKKNILILGVLCIGVASLLTAQGTFYRSLINVAPKSYIVPFSDSMGPSSSFYGDLLHKKDDIKHFVDWNQLTYFSSGFSDLSFSKGDDFVLEPSFTSTKEGRELLVRVYKDLLSLSFDKDMTVKRLSFLNSNFHSLLLERLYAEDFMQHTMSFSHIRYYALFPFTGKEGLISFFVKSRFYNREEPLETVDSPYISTSYKSLFIEARGLPLSPALFPNIYTRDMSGKLKLVYSFSKADKEKIIDNGYAHYITDEQEAIRDSKNFYTAALDVYGEAKTDIIISRESYLQFFSSPEAIKNLREGNLFFIVDNKTP